MALALTANTFTRSSGLTELRIRRSPVFKPLTKPSRYKAAYGGRGSGKSQFFADLMVARALAKPGIFGKLFGKGEVPASKPKEIKFQTKVDTASADKVKEALKSKK
jgi:hypothetical protein